MRGGTANSQWRIDFREGLSPHARGNPSTVNGVPAGIGPIPACAGEPFLGTWDVPHTRAYPRMRGGTLPEYWLSGLSTGLSPHARGNQSWPVPLPAWPGPIPACAGEPPRPCGLQSKAWAYPRMRGGTGVGSSTSAERSGLSPHARGNHCPSDRQDAHQGPIPACAGEPL